MTGYPEEPPATGWRAVRVADVVDGARFVGIDGRSSSGKTTVAGRIAAAVDGAAVVHTDDVAWCQAVLDWADLLVDGVLDPIRRGEPVAFRPPAWERFGREGAIEVAVGAPLVIVEGVGAARRALAEHYDLTLWVQSPRALIDDRNAVRVGAGEMTEGDFERWMAEELPFMAAERAWEHTDLVVDGTAPATGPELVVSDVLRRSGARGA